MRSLYQMWRGEGAESGQGDCNCSILRKGAMVEVMHSWEDFAECLVLHAALASSRCGSWILDLLHLPAKKTKTQYHPTYIVGGG